MKCPSCGYLDDKVIESRTCDQGRSIRRRRECLQCGARYTSYEKVEQVPLQVVKKNYRKELFSEDKIKKGLLLALKKRPVEQVQIDALLTAIMDQVELTAKSGHEVSTVMIGNWLLSELFKIDKVAYVRFASVYRDFATTSEFIDIINEIEE